MPRSVDRVYMRLHKLLMRPGRQQNAIDRLFIRWWTRLDCGFYSRFGWSASARMMGVDVLLLRTIGRRTGRRRDALVACTLVDGALVVGGGNWGWDRDPGWLHNLRAQPEVDVLKGREFRRMHATVLVGDDARVASDALARAYPHSQAYVARRVRPIAAVRLDPTASASEQTISAR